MMGEIGRRAAAEIRRTASENDTSYAVELLRIGVFREQLYQWEKDICDPTGKLLRGMALGGYDVRYILTGERK